jgi:hypothetical protein
MKARQSRSVVQHLADRNDAASDAQVTRADVLHGFEEAIDVARSRSNPAAMVAGWREIAKMCGYYAPERKEVRVNVVGSALRDELACMSDDELLALVTRD